MNKNVRLLIESFFDDEIFNTDNDIKSDLEDLGRFFDYSVGDIYYENDKPYAICCGDKSYFKDNLNRFCLLNDIDKLLQWRATNILVKELRHFRIKYFELKSFNDFRHIDEDGYKNTQIIKDNYDITEFPAFEYCLNLGDNVYLPAIDELLMMLLNNDKLGKYSFSNEYYWSSTLYSYSDACLFYTLYSNVRGVPYVNGDAKNYSINVRPFFRLD